MTANKPRHPSQTQNDLAPHRQWAGSTGRTISQSDRARHAPPGAVVVGFSDGSRDVTGHQPDRDRAHAWHHGVHPDHCDTNHRHPDRLRHKPNAVLQLGDDYHGAGLFGCGVRLNRQCAATQWFHPLRLLATGVFDQQATCYLSASRRLPSRLTSCSSSYCQSLRPLTQCKMSPLLAASL